MLPILRNVTMRGGVSTTPLSKKTFSRIIKSVLTLSGYFGTATIHAIRRYLGKKINGKFPNKNSDFKLRLRAINIEKYTEVERSQHITQTDTRVYGQSYVANTSSVDEKSVFLNEPAQHDHVNFFQSFAKFREKGLPTRLSARKEAAIRQDPQLIELENRIHRLYSENANSSVIQAAKIKARNYRACVTRQSLQQYQIEWVRERRD